MPNLRCDSKKHGILIPEKGLIEIKCNSRFCGAQRGTVVLHRFSIETGDAVETIKYSEPPRKEDRNGHSLRHP